MEFRDLKRQYSVLKQDIDKAMLETAASGAYIMGPQVRELEAQLAEYVGVKHCLTCANGTDALTLALKAWGIGPGDAVFVPDFTFFSSAEVVPLEGATPIFVDVREDTFNIDTEDLERAIKQTLAEGKLTPKVIVAVDLFGLPADYMKIREIANKYGLLILEDGAQGFGGSICHPERSICHPERSEESNCHSERSEESNRHSERSEESNRHSERSEESKACSFGDIATTSFFPAKPLGCYGDGGAVFTDNDDWAALIASYRIHGKGSFKYDNVRIGLNSRLDTLQAAILQVKLKAFRDYELDAVNAVADRYTSLLCHPERSEGSKVRSEGSIILPSIPAGFRSSWAQYTIKLKDATERDTLQASLKSLGIPSMVYYPKPLHLQTAFKNVILSEAKDLRHDSTVILSKAKDLHHDSNVILSEAKDLRHDSTVILSEAKDLCPVATALCDRVLSLPMHPYMTEEEITTVCNAIKAALT